MDRRSCPVCRAPMKEDSPACYRCRTDLTPLHRLSRAAAGLLGEARRAYRAGSYTTALDRTRTSLGLERSEEARDLEILCLFRTGARSEAFALWQRERHPGSL